jgi:hypothetical protein
MSTADDPFAAAAAASASPAAADPRHPRRRVLKKAIASYGDGSLWIEVLVRDISDNGVKLQVKETDFLPDHFHLFIELDGLRADCEVVRRDGPVIGCHFISAAQSSSASRVQILRESSDRRVTIRRRPIA